MIIMAMLAALATPAQKVTVDAVEQPASAVFRSLMEQTGKNFVYSSRLLDGMKVTVKAKNKPLKKVLSNMFAGTDIEFKIEGDKVLLKHRSEPEMPEEDVPVGFMAQAPRWLNEVTVESRIETPEIRSVQVGAKRIAASDISSTPVMFGEEDLVKTLQSLPGVAEGTEGITGMYVHGGNNDENLYLLDKVPLYQTGHLAGVFSTFNPGIIGNVDFYKSSVPAAYDGRLSSVTDVRTIDGSTDGHHGIVRLGSTAAALNISGPIGKNTTYVAGLRRTWIDLLSMPILALANSGEEEKVRAHYYFMDLNAKVNHRFSDRLSGFASLYIGNDYSNTGTKDDGFDGDDYGSFDDEKYRLHWGNLVAQTGMYWRLHPELTAEFAIAYSRYFSSMDHRVISRDRDEGTLVTREGLTKFDNNVSDWILRADFDWKSGGNSRIRYGGSLVRHIFRPSSSEVITVMDGDEWLRRDSIGSNGANEINAYIEDEWRISGRLRANLGLHGSLFYIGGKLKHGLSPRLSISYRPTATISLKADYTRTTQYVHQLALTYLSLPTDQWIPVSGDFKPSTADKVSAGAYWQSPQATYAAQAEAYYKWMHNLLDLCDEYYIEPPTGFWDARLTQGRGTAKGIDLKVEKLTGRLTGHIAYSLGWADRTFPGKNGGHTYPARFDNRHNIHVLISWNCTKKVQLNAAWTGRSGNRFTLLTQNWQGPSFEGAYRGSDDVPLREPINSYQLPFYHRLDLSMVIKSRRLDITLAAYNAYCHMNTVAIWQGYKNTLKNFVHWEWEPKRRTFYEVKLLPIIPSISFVWKF